MVPFAVGRHVVSGPNNGDWGKLMAKILESLSSTVIAGCVLTVIVAIILVSI